MPIKPTIDRNALTELRNALKEIDPALARALGKELKSEMEPFRAAIQGRMISGSPLSGLAAGYRQSWVATKVKVSATPGAGFGRPIVTFYVDGVGNKMAEFAGKGKKSYVKSTQGEAFIRNLDRVATSPGKEGRFFFQAYKLSRRSSQEAVGRVLDRFIEKGMGNV
jgi:hypothetical protein